jgi:hypothetical protein
MTEPSDSKESSNNKAKESVFLLARPSRCYACDKKLERGDLVKLKEGSDERQVLCNTCAKLDHMEILLSGNAQVTRLAKKYSAMDFPVMQWSDLWKCYQRVGILVEPAAVKKAKAECGVKENG